MSFRQLKDFLFRLSDLTYLSLVSGVDFFKKTISLKKTYWNIIISNILTVVDVPSRTQMRKLVSRLKEVLLLRLTRCSATSLKKFFVYGITRKFRHFSKEFRLAFFAEWNGPQAQPAVQPTEPSIPIEEQIEAEEEQSADDLDFSINTDDGSERLTDSDVELQRAVEEELDDECLRLSEEDRVPQNESALEDILTWGEDQVNSLPPDSTIDNPLEAFAFHSQGARNTTNSTFTPGQTFE